MFRAYFTPPDWNWIREDQNDALPENMTTRDLTRWAVSIAPVEAAQVIRTFATYLKSNYDDTDRFIPRPGDTSQSYHIDYGPTTYLFCVGGTQSQTEFEDGECVTLYPGDMYRFDGTRKHRAVFDPDMGAKNIVAIHTTQEFEPR